MLYKTFFSLLWFGEITVNASESCTCIYSVHSHVLYFTYAHSEVEVVITCQAAMIRGHGHWTTGAVDLGLLILSSLCGQHLSLHHPRQAWRSIAIIEIL